jgi:hypothetical protein
MKLVRLTKMCLNKMYSKVRIDKHLFDNIPIQNGLKPGDAAAVPATPASKIRGPASRLFTVTQSTRVLALRNTGC